MTDNLIKAVCTIAKYALGSFAVVWFGNRTDTNDLDILVLTEEVPLTSVLQHGLLDISLIELNQFYNLAQTLDPIATEPILTGILLDGDIEWWNKQQTDLKEIKPTPLISQYLFAKAHGVLKYAFDFSEMNTPESYRAAWANISYVLSYACFAIHYGSNKESPITLKVLRHNYTLLNAFWKDYSGTKRSPRSELVLSWLQQTQSFLRQHSTCS